jgi:hypothetical protein
MDLYPPGWSNSFYNHNDDCYYSWSFGRSAYSIDLEFLEDMLIKYSSELPGQIGIFALGAKDIRSFSPSRQNYNEVAERYLSAILNFKEKTGLDKVFILEPMDNGLISNAFYYEKFMETIKESFTDYVDGLIELPEYLNSKTYISCDKYHHMSIEMCRDVSNFVLNNIRSVCK